jgi:NADPH:quinone reductase-like Zn-dependent oxidoreductase
VAVEARNLAPLSGEVDHVAAATLPISGLTAWQALFTHARLTAGQTVLIHGAAGAVGSIAVQLARAAGAHVIGTGRASSRDTVLELGAQQFVDLAGDGLESAGDVDVVFDVIGGEILRRSAALVRAGGVLVSIVEPPPVRPADGEAVFFVVEPERQGLVELERRLRDGRLRPIVGEVLPLEQAASAFDPARRGRGKAVICVAES